MSEGQQNSVMVDTQVLIYSTRQLEEAAAKKWSPEVIEKIRRSKGLVQGLGTLRVSAIVLFEFLRGIRDIELFQSQRLISRMQVEACTAAVAEKAAEMIRHRVYTLRACEECLNLSAAKPCKKCNRSTSKVQRLNDALIAATAEETAGVETLYTFDKGILDLANNTRVDILEPPSLDGPLFDLLRDT